jgi:hypothetical protein
MISRKFIERGSDFVGFVTVKADPSTAADRILLTQAISPSAFPGTRLTQLAPLWERYRFRQFKLRWVPAVPKTLACQFIVYQDTDPNDDPTIITDANALIRQATAQAGSQQFNFINAKAINLAQRSDDQLYYTGPDKTNERFSRQGTFYVIQVTNPVNFNGEVLPADIQAGSLYVDWECEFQIAQINPTAVVAALDSGVTFESTRTDLISFESTGSATLNLSTPAYIYSHLVNFPASSEFNLLVDGVDLTVLLTSQLLNADAAGNTLLAAGNHVITSNVDISLRIEAIGTTGIVATLAAT